MAGGILAMVRRGFPALVAEAWDGGGVRLWHEGVAPMVSSIGATWVGCIGRPGTCACKEVRAREGWSHFRYIVAGRAAATRPATVVGGVGAS